MILTETYRREWTVNLRADLIAGLVVALALIPEAIAFSLIAGVDPKVWLYASFSIAVLVAITGGRPGMISAATAATAVLMVTLVRDHGLQYLLAATVLAGLLQIGMGLLKLGFVMRYVSKSVMTGFVNALAILIFMAQLPELDPRAVTWLTYALVAAGLAIIYLFLAADQSHPLAVGDDHRADRACDDLRLGCAHGGRHGRAARYAAGIPDPRHPADA
jgi:sulfate permease, SulP family